MEIFSAKSKIDSFDTYIFDFDNTLFNTESGMSICYEAALNAINISYDKTMLVSYMGEDLIDTVKRFSTKKEDFETFEKVFLETSKSCMVANSFPFPETKKVLDSLKDNGKNLGIVTGKSKDLVIEILDAFNMKGIFDAAYIVGYGDYNIFKPNPEAINKCISRMENNNITVGKAVYVGDSDTDIAAAKNAKIEWRHIVRGGVDLTRDEILSLEDLIIDFKIVINYVVRTNIFPQKIDNFESLINNWCSGSNYDIETDKNNYKKIKFDDCNVLTICKNGYLIFTCLYNDKLLSDPVEVLEWKKQTIDEAINNGLPMIEKYKSIFYNKAHDINVKVCYGLTSYKLYSTYEISGAYVNNILWLLSKNNPKIDINREKDTFENVKDELNKLDARYIQLSQECIVASLWGARLFFYYNNEYQNYWNDYLNKEIDIQYEWQFISDQTELLNDYIGSDKKKLLNVMDEAYDIMNDMAQFHYENNQTSSRVELEIIKMLYEVSHLDDKFEYYRSKSKLIERQITIYNQDKENEISSHLNTLMLVLAFVSAFSAINEMVQIVKSGNVIDMFVAVVFICISVIVMIKYLHNSK